jgi:hypothetical protein
MRIIPDVSPQADKELLLHRRHIPFYLKNHFLYEFLNLLPVFNVVDEQVDPTLPVKEQKEQADSQI